MSDDRIGRNQTINRATGLLILEVRHSNPNGDPDAESEPRTIDSDGRGLISPVSVKRKVRDLVADKAGPVWAAASLALGLVDPARFGILESRGRDRKAITDMGAEEFLASFWDARVFGNTFLEDMKDSGAKPGDKEHFISTGVVQFGPGVSVAPVEIERLTLTNKSGVEEGKDRGMAPLGWRVVRHGVYSMPFFINPMQARKTGCSAEDIDLLQFVLPHVFRSTASAIRPQVEILHAWFAEHKTSLGSIPDYLVIDALAPVKVRGTPSEPSVSRADYQVPDALPGSVMERLASFEDLCLKQW
jgi:Cas7 group CRISPR-associated protein Csh2